MGTAESAKHRFSRREARAALLAEGRRLLLERGVEAGLNRLTLIDAVSGSGVPRASAYRVFSDTEVDPQVAFRLAVLTDLIDSIHPRTDVASDAIAGVDLRTECDGRERAAALREIIRTWTEANLAVTLEDRSIHVIDVTGAAASVDPSADRELLDAIRRSHARSHEAFRPYYEAVLEAFGLRTRTGITIENVASMFRAASEMALQEHTLQPSTRRFTRPTGPAGSLQEWTLLGLAIEGFTLACFEQNPMSDVETDLSSWL